MKSPSERGRRRGHEHFRCERMRESMVERVCESGSGKRSPWGAALRGSFFQPTGQYERDRGDKKRIGLAHLVRCGT